MAEFEELRLTVSLNDNASQGLAALREQLQALGNADQLGNLQRMSRQVEDLSKKMGGVRESAERASNGVRFLSSMISGALTGAMTALAANFGWSALTRFNDQIIRLNGVASLLGVSTAQIKGVVDQMKRMGVDEGQATAAVQQFGTAMQNMMRMGSEVRQKLMSMAKTDPAAMDAWIASMVGAANQKDLARSINIFMDGVETVFKNELARTGNAMKAAGEANKLIDALGLDLNTWNTVKGRLTSLSQAQIAAIDELVKQQLKWKQELAAADKIIEGVVQGIQMGLIGAIRNLNTALGDTDEQMAKAFGKRVADSLVAIANGFIAVGAALTPLVNLMKSVPPEMWAVLAGAYAGAKVGRVAGAPGAAVGAVVGGVGGALGYEAATAPELGTGVGAEGPVLPGTERRTMNAENRRIMRLQRQQFLRGREAPADPQRNERLDQTLKDLSFSPISFNRAEDNRSSSAGSSQFSRAVQVGVFDALVQYSSGGRGGVGGGGGGVTNASYSPGGGGGVSSTGGGGFQMPGGGTLGGGRSGPIQMPGGGSASGPYGSHVGPGTGVGAGDTPPAGGAGGAGGASGITGGATAEERNQLALIEKYESGGQNVMNYVGRRMGLDPATPKGFTAQGHFQILNSNWAKIAPKLGISAPNAMAASREDQSRVALELLRNPKGMGNWSNYNPALRGALGRGERAPISPEQIMGGSGGGGAEGGGSPGPTSQPGGPAGRAPQDGEVGPAQALALARTRLGQDEMRDTGKLSQFFSSQGIKINPATTAWCAAFVNSNLNAAGVKGTGSLAAGSFTRWGQGVGGEQSVQAGDVGVVRGRSPRTGIEGSHVGFLSGNTRTDASGREMVEMIGGNQSGTVSGRGGVSSQWRPRSSLHVRRASDDMVAGRRMLDGGVGSEQRVTGTGKLTVDVRAPRGSKVGAEGGGIFKKTEMNRSTQMEPAESGPPVRNSPADEMLSI